MEDCIKILDLPDEFDLKILKKSYRKQVMKYHPDKASNEEERETFEVMMKLINASYEQVKKYLETHGGIYSKPEENYNSYNSAKTEEKATDSNDTKTKEETYKQKKEKSDKEREEYIKKRVKEYEDLIKEEREKERAKEEETSYYQEQTYVDNSYTDNDNYEEEEPHWNYAEGENVEMSESETYMFLLWLPVLELIKVIMNPIKAVLWVIGLYVISKIIYITAEENELLSLIYHFLVVPVCATLFICYHNKIVSESGNVSNYCATLKENIRNRIKESAFYKDYRARVERIENEESIKRMEKYAKKHQAEREKIERERMRKFEEEWERKHPEENTTKKK